MKKIIKVILTILSISSLVFILFVGIISLPWVIIFVGLYLSPDPPKPIVKFAEFPFKLVYKIDGQQKVINDTLICKYDGIGMNEGQGKYRQWKSQLASGNKDIILKQLNNKTQIIYIVGSPEDYMGDSENFHSEDIDFRSAILKQEFDVSGIDSKTLKKMYNISIISFKISEPIKNQFK